MWGQYFGSSSGALIHEIVFYVRALYYGYANLCLVVARLTLVWHPLVSHHGIKKPHGSAAHRFGPRRLVDSYGALMNGIVFRWDA